MNAICRFVLNAALRMRGAVLLGIASAVALLVTLPPTSARAEITQKDAIDYAIRYAGGLTGISIPPEAVHMLNDMVTCGVKGGSVGECAKQAAVNVALQDAPAEVKQIAGCFVGGGNALDCAKQAGLSKVPPEARPVVECLAGGGSVAGCAAKVAVGEAMARVPEEARELVQCVAGGGSAAQCGAAGAAANLPPGSEAQKVAQCIAGGQSAASCAQQFGTGIVNAATTQAMNLAVEHMKALRGEEDRLDPSNATVNNIVMLARGIDQGRVDLIILGGGPEVAKAVLTAIITAIVPPAGLIAGPVIGALVDLYATTGRELLDKIMKLVKGDGEISDIGELLFQFYFQEMIARPCALLPDKLKDTVCGALADVIAAAAGVFGDALDVVLKVVEGILTATGVMAVLGWLGDAWDAIFGDGLEDPKVCGSPQEYFAKNHLPCLAAAVGASAPNLNGACIDNFKRCHKDPGSVCGNLDKALADQAKKINDALEEGARAYSPAVGAFIQGRREQLCGFGYEKNLDVSAETVRLDFSRQCGNGLTQRRPLDPSTCRDGNARGTGTHAHRNACYNALGDGNLQQLTGKTLAQHIAETCKTYCEADRDNCAPNFDTNGCFPEIPQTVHAFGFTYVPTKEQILAAQLSWCHIKPWSIYDRIDRVIHWPDKIASIIDWRPDRIWQMYTPRNVITSTPNWAVSNVGVLVDQPLANLAVGSCRSTRTMATPVMAWSSTRTSSPLLRDSPRDFSQIMQVAMISPSPPALKLQLSIKSVALVTGGFDSCTGMGVLASRGSSGSDGAYTPRGNTVTRTNKGGASANRGTSGSYTSRDPRGSSGASSAIDRLTGDGMGGGAGGGVGSNYRLPDTARGPIGSSGSSPAWGGNRGSGGAGGGQSGGSSGSSTAQPGGIPGTRPGGSSGASMPAGGPGVRGTFGPSSNSGTIRQNRPAIQQIYRPQQQQQPPPSDYRSRVN